MSLIEDFKNYYVIPSIYRPNYVKKETLLYACCEPYRKGYENPKLSIRRTGGGFFNAEDIPAETLGDVVARFPELRQLPLRAWSDPSSSYNQIDDDAFFATFGLDEIDRFLSIDSYREESGTYIYVRGEEIKIDTTVSELKLYLPDVLGGE